LNRCDEFVLVGMETDVCVAHSAIGLMGLGFQVAVVDDGYVPATPRLHGIAPCEAGAVITQ
jgi:nicotinamidase-related amidase